MKLRGSKQEFQALLSACGFIVFGIAMLVWFILGVTHAVKTHGDAMGVAFILAVLSILVGVIGVLGIRRVRKLALDRPDEPK